MALPSEGNKFSSAAVPMTVPSLGHLFRLEVEMCSPAERIIINGPQGVPTTRIIMPILGGKLSGSNVNGVISKAGGADWATNVGGTDFTTLDARYSILTDDNCYLSICSRGTFSLPGLASSDSMDPASIPPTITQEISEWFTHITIEAPGASPYNYLNSTLAVGCLSQTNGVIFIDVYRLTNFPHDSPKDIMIPTVHT